MPDQNQKISWQAHEFKHYYKNAGWYVVLFAVAVLVIAFFVIVESDIFAAVCLAIIVGLIYFFSKQYPRLVDIEVNHRGVSFDNLFYPYKQLKYFWIVYTPHHQSVNFQTSALVNNTLILELEDQDPEAVRQFLLSYLPEHPQTEPTPAQRIMHRFKF